MAANIPMTITIKGLPEVERKLGFAVLAEPALLTMRPSVDERVRRGGKGMGAKRNQIMTEPKELGGRFMTTLNYPRTTGSSWQKYNVRVIRRIWGNIMRKVIKQIEATWAR